MGSLSLSTMLHDSKCTKRFLLSMQVQDLAAQARSQGDTEDEIMVAVNNKVEEWKVSSMHLVLLLAVVRCDIRHQLCDL